MFNDDLQQIVDHWRGLAVEYRQRPLLHDELADPFASANRLEFLADQLVTILVDRVDPAPLPVPPKKKSGKAAKTT